MRSIVVVPVHLEQLAVHEIEVDELPCLDIVFPDALESKLMALFVRHVRLVAIFFIFLDHALIGFAWDVLLLLVRLRVELKFVR